MTPFKSVIDAFVSMYLVEDGAQVEEGDHVMILEVMKMQSYIEAPASGVVRFKVQLGETVSSGTTLGVIEEN